MIKIFFLVTILFLASSLIFWQFKPKSDNPPLDFPISSVSTNQTINPTFVNTATLDALPDSKVLQNDYHVFQSFNNCGPAALSMALSYFGINKTQQELGQQLRPYQNPQGDNDDKSVTLEEVAAKAEEFGLISYLRPNGDITKIKQFIAAGIPVIARTYLKKGEDIGHYRIVKGYDDGANELTQDDSLQGKNLKYSYSAFDELWSDFNHEYLVMVTQDKKQIAEKIIGEDLDFKLAWQKATAELETKLKTDPNNQTTLFNLSVAKYHTGDFEGSVKAYEQVENRLPFRTLWYQIEPIYSYYELGNYERVIQIADQVLENHNRAYSELYILKARIFLKQGHKPQAAEQLALSKLYNQSMQIDPKLLEEIN